MVTACLKIFLRGKKQVLQQITLVEGLVESSL
jgi:hypothetical protein